MQRGKKTSLHSGVITYTGNENMAKITAITAAITDD